MHLVRVGGGLNTLPTKICLFSISFPHSASNLYAMYSHRIYSTSGVHLLFNNGYVLKQTGFTAPRGAPVLFQPAAMCMSGVLMICKLDRFYSTSGVHL